MGQQPWLFCGAQAPDGTLYFGGDDLMTFDGERWTVTPVSGLKVIRSIVCAEDGKIWVSAPGNVGWFERTANGTLQFHSLTRFTTKSTAFQGTVSRVVVNRNGVTFAAGGKVYRFARGELKCWTVPELRNPNAWPVGDEVWVQSFGSGVYRVTDEGPRLIEGFDLGTAEEAMFLWVNPRGGSWIVGTRGGLLLHEDGAYRTFPPDTGDALLKALVASTLQLPDGRFVFSTSEKGIVIVGRNGQIEQQLGAADGLSIRLSGMFLDREGSVWVCSNRGADRLNLTSPTRLFDERFGVPRNPHYRVRAASGLVAAGSAAGVVVHRPGTERFEPLPQVERTVNALGETPRGLLLATRNRLWEITNDGTTQLSHVATYANDLAISRNKPGEVLAALVNGTVVAFSPGAEPQVRVAGLPVAAWSLAEGTDGTLWLGTESHGLFVAPPSKEGPSAPVRVTVPGLPELTENNAHVRATAAGDILVFANEGGWVRPAGTGTFVPIRDLPKRAIAVAGVSAVSPKGTVWIVHPAATLAACVGRISPDGGWHWEPHAIPDLNAVGAPLSIAAEEADDGTTVLWIGTVNSLLRHEVQPELSAPRPQSPLLRAYRRDEHGQRYGMAAVIPYSTPAIEFEFAQPEYVRRATLRLQTKIEGIDSEWIAAAGDSRRELTAARDGKYTFQVRAVAETGIASEPTVFAFVVAPPWWRSPVALWLEAAALSLIGFAAYRWRVRTLHRRNAELESKVRERTEELVEANAAKTQFVANMSHDIRNPLNGIVGLTLALEDTPLDAQQRELTSTLRECTSYLSTLVDDVLDFASIEAGKIELRPAPFVPAELLNSVVTTLTGESTSRGAYITIESDPEVPPLLLGDAGRIQQILVNYVSNALKYAGGHIRLSASVSPARPDEVEFAVADDGLGISKADQATLFTKFGRLAGARESRVRGTGLGLASCRAIADIMGASVGVESEVGQGARFFLRVPLVTASEPVAAPDDVLLPATTVLLVEDTEYNALAARAVLRKLGLGCDRARTGREALQLYGEKRHSIVLLDRNLPDLDGLEVARRLRELETDGRQALILAVTAYCTSEDKALCLDAGMNAFLGKPLTPDKLRRVLLAEARQVVTGSNLSVTPAPSNVGERTREVVEPALDTTLLEYLAEPATGGLGGQLERLIDDLRTAHEQLQGIGMHRAAETADAAHRLLGSARMVNAAALVDLLIKIETAARQEDSASLGTLWPRVEPQVAALTAALRRHPAAS